MNARSLSTSFGGVVDDARFRWQEAERAARDAFVLATSGAATDPVEASRRANALQAVAERLRREFEIASAASEERATNPVRAIDLKKMREAREEAANPPGLLRKLGTFALLASPLAVAALLVRRNHR